MRDAVCVCVVKGKIKRAVERMRKTDPRRSRRILPSTPFIYIIIYYECVYNIIHISVHFFLLFINLNTFTAAARLLQSINNATI